MTSYIRDASPEERFDFFVKRLAKLRLWQDFDNFEKLKHIAVRYRPTIFFLVLAGNDAAYVLRGPYGMRGTDCGSVRVYQQAYMDDLRRSCDDLYEEMKQEDKGEELINFATPGRS